MNFNSERTLRIYFYTFFHKTDEDSHFSNFDLCLFWNAINKPEGIGTGRLKNLQHTAEMFF